MQNKSFNIVHAAVVLFAAIILTAILIPAINAARQPEKQYANSSQLRGMHQGLVTYANSNKNYFVGLNPDGTTHDLRVEYRFQFLIENDYFTPEYAINPWEDYEVQSPIVAWDLESPFTANNYSYAMLQVPEAGGRRDEWKQTLNSQAIVVSDRNTDTKAQPRSIYNDKHDKAWQGQVLWNDNHVEFTFEDRIKTKYGNGELNEADQLFEAAGRDDALMVHSGN